MSLRLFVSNLPQGENENDLRNAFSTYGQVTNLEFKSKTEDENVEKKFAFVTLISTHNDVEKCINYFSNHDYKGNKLYVVHARESFLDRLKRERNESQKKDNEKDLVKNSAVIQNHNPIIKLGDKLNPRSKKYELPNVDKKQLSKNIQNDKIVHKIQNKNSINHEDNLVVDKKKHLSDNKRLESLKRKRQEFKEKKQMIKTLFVDMDKMPNKKIKFMDNDDQHTPIEIETSSQTQSDTRTKQNKNLLFDDETDEEFDVKEQFKSNKNQKVLELQSKYKSDKRFTLDEKFVEEDEAATQRNNESIAIKPNDEITKQMNILQDVLGVQIKSSLKTLEKDNKKKSKLGMFRYDPLHPDHAKFLMTKEEFKKEPEKTTKKNKTKETQPDVNKSQQEEVKVEVSKEQFYNVTEKLKEAIVQPNTFSIRSLFSKNNDEQVDEEPSEEFRAEHETTYNAPLLKAKESKIKNPLDPGQRNPFVYDSSDSESEEQEKESKNNKKEHSTEVKAVWKETLFFLKNDQRLKDGLIYFSSTIQNGAQKERRDLKSLMKKRIHNNERKNKMFKKKIGGKRKSIKRFKNKQ